MFIVSDDIPDNRPPAVQVSRNHDFDDPGVAVGLSRSAWIVRGRSPTSSSHGLEAVCLSSIDRGAIISHRVKNGALFHSLSSQDISTYHAIHININPSGSLLQLFSLCWYSTQSRFALTG